MWEGAPEPVLSSPIVSLHGSMRSYLQAHDWLVCSHVVHSERMRRLLSTTTSNPAKTKVPSTPNIATNNVHVAGTMRNAQTCSNSQKMFTASKVHSCLSTLPD